MPTIGKYLYCIINGREGRNFGPLGIGEKGDVVTTVGYEDLSAVISDTPMTRYVVNGDNLMSHEKVIEKVMEDYTVLPVRFCTIATSNDEIRSLLRKRYHEFKNLLRDMDNKIELSLKATWKNMTRIFEEIPEEDKEVKRLKKEIKVSSSNQPGSYHPKAIHLGKAVQKALEVKKEQEGTKVIQRFKKLYLDYKSNPTVGDSMFLNAAFLVDRTRQKDFTFSVQELETVYEKRTLFRYAGPLPPFNFVNVVIHWG